METFIRRAKEKHQWNRRKHKIPLLLLLNLPQDFMQTLFGADTTNLLTCFLMLKYFNVTIFIFFFFVTVYGIEDEQYVNRIFSHHCVI